MLYSLFCTSVKCLVVTKQRFIDRKKAKFFGSLVFFSLILSAYAMPAGGLQEVKDKAYLRFSRKTVLNDKTYLRFSRKTVLNDKTEAGTYTNA
jgi:hypothetical protein